MQTIPVFPGRAWYVRLYRGTIPDPDGGEPDSALFMDVGCLALSDLDEDGPKPGAEILWVQKWVPVDHLIPMVGELSFAFVGPDHS